jgi:hypothetical protein
VKAVSDIVTIGAVTFTLGNCQIVIVNPIDLQCGTCGASKDTLGKPIFFPAPGKWRNRAVHVLHHLRLATASCAASKAPYRQSYSATEHATGGTGTYTYSIVSGSLPPGLTLNSFTGMISGSPTVTGGTYTFTSKAIDSVGNSDTAVCTITVSRY